MALNADERWATISRDDGQPDTTLRKEARQGKEDEDKLFYQSVVENGARVSAGAEVECKDGTGAKFVHVRHGARKHGFVNAKYLTYLTDEQHPDGEQEEYDMGGD